MPLPPKRFLPLKLRIAAAAACLALHAPLSHALALGQSRVLSSIGEPLVLEIDIPQIAVEEINGLRAGIASPAEFEAAGMAFHPAFRELTFSLNRRPDGRLFLRINGTRPMNEPYIDLLLRVQGGTGPAVLRDYTLLLDPPRTPGAAPAAAAPTPAGTPPIALGQARVLSARGEPLRAEIEIPQLSSQNETVRAAMASPAEFQAAGMRYSPSLVDVQFNFQRRPDGRLFLSLTSNAPFNEPSLDVILEASWTSGKTVRDYSVPMAPPVAVAAPTLPRAPAPAPAAAATAAPAPPPSPRTATGVVTEAPAAAPPATVAAAPPPPAPPSPPPAPPPAPPAPAPAPPAAAPAAAAPPAPAVAAAPMAAPAPAPAAASRAPVATPQPQEQTVEVRAGDTASKIARAHKPREISLDQMLLALLRANPDAFINGNVNLLKAGARLKIPGEEQAAATLAEDATETLSLQSKNFDDYKRKLAMEAPRVAAPARESSGKVEANVTEKTPAAKPPNKLTLSDGRIGNVSAEEQKIAARLARLAAQRAARLSREVSEVSRLQGTANVNRPAASGAASAPTAAASAASASVAAVPAVPASARAATAR